LVDFFVTDTVFIFLRVKRMRIWSAFKQQIIFSVSKKSAWLASLAEKMLFSLTIHQQGMVYTPGGHLTIVSRTCANVRRSRKTLELLGEEFCASFASTINVLETSGWTLD
jgi:hypothetical protein